MFWLVFVTPILWKTKRERESEWEWEHYLCWTWSKSMAQIFPASLMNLEIFEFSMLCLLVGLFVCLAIKPHLWTSNDVILVKFHRKRKCQTKDFNGSILLLWHYHAFTVYWPRMNGICAKVHNANRISTFWCSNMRQQSHQNLFALKSIQFWCSTFVKQTNDRITSKPCWEWMPRNAIHWKW